MAKQAKCTMCKIRYTWDRGLKLKSCVCPRCGAQLAGTTKNLRDWPVRDMGSIRPIAKTNIVIHPTGQAVLYCSDTNKYRACRWKQ